MKERAFAEAAKALARRRDRRHLSRGQAHGQRRAQSVPPGHPADRRDDAGAGGADGAAGLWGSFFSRSHDGKAMRRLRGMFSRIALVAAPPVPAERVTLAGLQATVLALARRLEVTVATTTSRAKGESMSEGRNAIFDWAQQRRLAPAAVPMALRLAGVTPDAAQWRQFIDRLLLGLGVLMLATGTIFFLAANWQELGRYRQVRVGRDSHRRSGRCLLAIRPRFDARQGGARRCLPLHRRAARAGRADLPDGRRHLSSCLRCGHWRSRPGWPCRGCRRSGSCGSRFSTSRSFCTSARSTRSCAAASACARCCGSCSPSTRWC